MCKNNTIFWEIEIKALFLHKFSERMKRVFHIITHFDMGGAEQVAVSIAKSETKDIEYHLVEVVRGSSDFTDVFIRNLNDAHIAYHRSFVPDVQFHFLFERLAALLFPIRFIFLYLRYHPNVIHSHTEVPDMSVFVFFKVFPFLLKRCKVVRTIHNTKLWTGQKHLGEQVERFFQRCGANVAISPAVDASYQQVYGSHSPVIYNGVVAVYQKDYPKLVKGKANILFAGRFEEQKGISVLIEIIQALKDDVRYYFHVVGSGRLQMALNERLKNCENVTVTPPVFGISSFLASFDYLLMPSLHEGLSILALEAGFNGLPVIANDCAGIRETLPDNWPLKVKNNDEESYLHLFQDVLPEMNRETLKELSHTFVNQHFSIRKMQQSYERLY
jgi:glycosyltransferase involved in cell wall biosynthesis